MVGPLSSQPARAVPYDDVELGADLRVGADLRLDDKGRGSVGVELHREGAPDGGWTGARATARVPAPHELTISAELELVVPDDPKMGTGTVWPWALLAAGWKHGPWEIAAAVEASASALESSRVDALVRVGRAWTLGGGS